MKPPRTVALIRMKAILILALMRVKSTLILALMQGRSVMMVCPVDWDTSLTAANQKARVRVRPRLKPSSQEGSKIETPSYSSPT